jgi:hypothetical protein
VAPIARSSGAVESGGDIAAAHGPAARAAHIHTRDFVEIANRLTERTGLAERVRFLQHDALALPFASASFDILKPGGRLAIDDPVKGDRQPVSYPVPWAREG